MNITYNKANGNLIMSADINEQKDIQYILDTKCCGVSMVDKEHYFISHYLQFEDLTDQIACFGGPALSDGENVFGFMDYAVVNFLELLAKGEEIVWQKG